jgi:hypothetical protein
MSNRRDRHYLVSLICAPETYLLAYVASAGFGLGALNDADEDDLDVYEGISTYDPSRSRMAYDRTDDDDDGHISINTRRGVGVRIFLLFVLPLLTLEIDI